jgi:hypothetical protein
MNHFATPDFWHHYRHLPDPIRALADKNFALLRENRHHPSLRCHHFQCFLTAKN